MENTIVNGIIYCYTCSANGKKYVGQTTNLRRRIRGHKSHNQKRGCSAFYRAIEKYGYDNFTFAILQEGITTREELNRLEGEYIDRLNTLAPNGYNLKTGGSEVHHTEDFKANARAIGLKNASSKSFRAKVYDNPEWRRKVSEASKKAWDSPEYQAKQAALGRVKKTPEEIRRGVISGLIKQARRNVAAKINAKENKIKAAEAHARKESKKHPCYCNENGKTYESATAAAKDLGLDQSCISKILKGDGYSTGGYSFESLRPRVKKNNHERTGLPPN